MSQEELNLVQACASILAAIGTVAAVIVALYLGRRDEKVRLRVEAGFYYQYLIRGIARISYEQEAFNVTVTNIGRRRAAISAVRICVGSWRPKCFGIMFPFNAQNASLPSIIDDGEQAYFSMPQEQFKEVLKEIERKVGGPVDEAHIRIAIDTMNGGSFKGKLRSKRKKGQ